MTEETGSLPRGFWVFIVVFLVVMYFLDRASRSTEEVVADFASDGDIEALIHVIEESHPGDRAHQYYGPGGAGLPYGGAHFAVQALQDIIGDDAEKRRIISDSIANARDRAATPENRLVISHSLTSIVEPAVARLRSELLVVALERIDSDSPKLKNYVGYFSPYTRIDFSDSVDPVDISPQHVDVILVIQEQEGEIVVKSTEPLLYGLSVSELDEFRASIRKIGVVYHTEQSIASYRRTDGWDSGCFNGRWDAVAINAHLFVFTIGDESEIVRTSLRGGVPQTATVSPSDCSKEGYAPDHHQVVKVDGS